MALLQVKLRNISRRRVEVAGFGFRLGEEGAKEIQFVVDII